MPPTYKLPKAKKTLVRVPESGSDRTTKAIQVEIMKKNNSNESESERNERNVKSVRKRPHQEDSATSEVAGKQQKVEEIRQKIALIIETKNKLKTRAEEIIKQLLTENSELKDQNEILRRKYARMYALLQQYENKDKLIEMMNEN